MQRVKLGSKVRLAPPNTGDTIYTVISKHRAQGLLFFRLSELPGSVFLASSLMSARTVLN